MLSRLFGLEELGQSTDVPCERQVLAMREQRVLVPLDEAPVACRPGRADSALAAPCPSASPRWRSDVEFVEEDARLRRVSRCVEVRNGFHMSMTASRIPVLFVAPSHVIEPDPCSASASIHRRRTRSGGALVGYNKKRKGARSCFCLFFCTLAQTAQVLDFLHRSGNVHDSNRAREFILACIQEVHQALPGMRHGNLAHGQRLLQRRGIVSALQAAGVEFTPSVCLSSGSWNSRA